MCSVSLALIRNLMELSQYIKILVMAWVLTNPWVTVGESSMYCSTASNTGLANVVLSSMFQCISNSSTAWSAVVNNTICWSAHMGETVLVTFDGGMSGNKWFVLEVEKDNSLGGCRVNRIILGKCMWGSNRLTLNHSFGRSGFVCRMEM